MLGECTLVCVCVCVCGICVYVYVSNGNSNMCHVTARLCVFMYVGFFGLSVHVSVCVCF